MKGINLENKNGMWAGDAVGYHALHNWIRARFTKPSLCQKCGIKPPLDMANISGLYKRDLSDWEYLCRACHMKSDGRIELMVERNISNRILSDMTCPACLKSFRPNNSLTRFCSKSCSNRGRYKIYGTE